MPNTHYLNALVSLQQAGQEAARSGQFGHYNSLNTISSIISVAAVHVGRAMTEMPRIQSVAGISQHTYGIAKFKDDVRVYPTHLRGSWIVLSPSLRNVTGRYRRSNVSVAALFIKRVADNVEISIGDVKIRDIRIVTESDELKEFEQDALISSLQQESVVS